MSYTGYGHFTRKQCGVIYGAFKRGDLTPPRDCRGRVKKPGFVYGYENSAIRQGFFLDGDERLLNGQLMTLSKVVELVFEREFGRAQALLDGSTEDMYMYFPENVKPERMWKAVTL